MDILTNAELSELKEQINKLQTENQLLRENLQQIREENQRIGTQFL